MNTQKKVRLFNLYFIKSISFYPALISLMFIGLALLMLNFERQGLSNHLYGKLESIIISNNETARTTITTIITGIISIMVFSFTMVMVVLNQTGTNYSPRLIPGLITSRSHQIVLGFYLGTIIYSLIIMINIESEDLKYSVPGTSILMDVVFAVICLGLFVFFIHSISKSIQIGSIMESLHRDTLNEIKKETAAKASNKDSSMPEVKQWFNIESPESGFMQGVDEEVLASLAEKHDIIIKLLAPPGFYIQKGIPFIRINKNSDENDGLRDEVVKSFTFRQEEIIGVNYLHGFKHLSEIAVKALSPGINDPGTAGRALNYMTDLFGEYMRLPQEKIICDKNDNPRIIFDRMSLRDMLLTYLSPIRSYGKTDLTVTKKILEISSGMAQISRKCKLPYLDELQEFALSVVEDAGKNIHNSLDRKYLNEIISKKNHENVFKSSLPLL